MTKLAGGVDQFVDWSKSVPRRAQKRPDDQTGDFDDQARSTEAVKV